MTNLKVQLEFVPPGGGEPEFIREWDGPQVPQAGDVIQLDYGKRRGRGTFIVIRTVWSLLEDRQVAQVVCEFASGHVDGAYHKQILAEYPPARPCYPWRDLDLGEDRAATSDVDEAPEQEVTRKLGLIHTSAKR